MPGRGRPSYTGPLRRPGEKPSAATTSQSAAEENESDLQLREQVERLEASLGELIDDESPATPPEPVNSSTYLTPPTTPGEKLVNGKADSPVVERVDEKPAVSPPVVSPPVSSPPASSPPASSLPASSPPASSLPTPVNVPDAATKSTSILNPAAAEFVPSWATQSENAALPEEPLTIYNATADDLAIESFNYSFVYLTQNPQDFDFVAEELKNHLEVYVNEESTLELITNYIFEWCINEPNFRYTGARLANYLNAHLKFDPANIKTSFMRVFMIRCKQELLFCKESPKTNETLPRMGGFASFLGELYCVFRMKEDAPPLGPLRRGTLEMIELLLDNPTEETLITAGKVLKLAGALLDNVSYFSGSDSVEQMENIFKRIDKLCVEDASTSKRAKEFLLSVTKLRSSKWGQIEVGTPSPTTQKIPFAYPAGSTAYTPPGTPPQPGLTGASAAVAAMSVPDAPVAWSQEDSLRPVTNPEQWNEFWTGEDEGSGNDEMFQYFSQPWSDGEVDDFEMEFKKFLIESEQLP